MSEPTLRPWTAEDADEEPSYLLVSAPGAFHPGESAVVAAFYRVEDRTVALRALRLLAEVEAPSVPTVDALVSALIIGPRKRLSGSPNYRQMAFTVLAALRRVAEGGGG